MLDVITNLLLYLESEYGLGRCSDRPVSKGWTVPANFGVNLNG